jgi:hypothetical protein
VAIAPAVLHFALTVRQYSSHACRKGRNAWFAGVLSTGRHVGFTVSGTTRISAELERRPGGYARSLAEMLAANPPEA